ncbi:hypothetical protein [uncultured Maricaulis sp.]|uniref:hypothetical protein n=1 Tax=uncultured Maricaulis sp. TaxID=174710 RepID=UPI0030DD7BD7|tara:strand:- start:17783 stop:18088 length:306 start_codon:yes stop_codon:yes gene_type:complete
MRKWSTPLPFSAMNERRVPNRPGVYVLLRSESDPSSVLKIASSRSLREAFKHVAAEPVGNWPVAPKAFLYFESLSESEEAERFRAEYKRRRGEFPMYNSGF